jgi:hypothetical protein
MFGIGKRTGQPPPDITLVPVSLDNAHSVVQRRNDYPSKNTQNAYTAHDTPEFPAVPNQDKILTHWYRPPDQGNPQVWWDDNNNDRIDRTNVNEHFQTNNWPEYVDPKYAAHNPWHNDIRGTLRPTAEQSPSNYRFVRPFYPGDGYAKSTGTHFSMASNRRAYPVNGMQPARSFRNTFRLEPTARDAENMDLSGPNAAVAEPAVYVSPTATQRRWGL